MPGPERPGPPSGDPGKEQEPPPYYHASRFQNERPAAKAYTKVQNVVFNAQDKADLSIYRFLLNRVSHVTVIGDPPPQELDEKITRILASGEPTSLPPAVLKTLLARRAQANQLGSWVEGHYQPGQTFYPADDERP